MDYAIGRRTCSLSEIDVRDVAAGRTTGRAVIDQAEDIRRAVRYHTTDQLEEIHVALTRADMALAEAVSERISDPRKSDL